MPPKSRKRQNIEDESKSAPRQSKRLVRDDSVLAAAVSTNLRLSSGSGDSYDLGNLPSSASGFKNFHIEVLRARVNPASAESDVIPTVEGMSHLYW